MNEASTSISMELIPNAYQKPVICDGDFCGYGTYGISKFGSTHYK